jgi:hypothetical protein
MKQIATNYTFNSAEKTVTLRNLNITLSQILMIASKGKVLYSFADGVGPANFVQGSDSVLTLQSTAGIQDSDPLVIFYDDAIDSTARYINRYAVNLSSVYYTSSTSSTTNNTGRIVLNYNPPWNGGTYYGLGKILIPENTGRNSIDVVSTADSYLLFGETVQEAYSKLGSNMNRLTEYLTTFGEFLSANVKYTFDVDKTTFGKVFVWNGNVSEKFSVFASERSSVAVDTSIQSYYSSSSQIIPDLTLRLLRAVDYGSASDGTPIVVENPSGVYITLSSTDPSVAYFSQTEDLMIPFRIHGFPKESPSALSALTLSDISSVYPDPQLSVNNGIITGTAVIPRNQNKWTVSMVFNDDLITEGLEPAIITFGTGQSCKFVLKDGTEKLSLINKLSSTIFYAGNSSGFQDGSGSDAKFNRITGMAFDASGNAYIADSLNHRIRKMTTTELSGNITTYAGTGVAGLTDGLKDSATFYEPSTIAIDNIGNIYISNYYSNNTSIPSIGLRKIDNTGTVSILSNNIRPYHLATDNENNLYYDDVNNVGVYKMNSSGGYTTIVTAGSELKLTSITGMAVNKTTKDIYVCGQDYSVTPARSRLYKIDSNKTISELSINNVVLNPGDPQLNYHMGRKLIYVNGKLYFLNTPDYGSTANIFIIDLAKNESVIMKYDVKGWDGFQKVSLTEGSSSMVSYSALPETGALAYHNGYLYVGWGNKISRLKLLQNP